MADNLNPTQKALRIGAAVIELRELASKLYDLVTTMPDVQVLENALRTENPDSDFYAPFRQLAAALDCAANPESYDAKEVWQATVEEIKDRPF